MFCEDAKADTQIPVQVLGHHLEVDFTLTALDQGILGYPSMALYRTLIKIHQIQPTEPCTPVSGHTRGYTHRVFTCSHSSLLQDDQHYKQGTGAAAPSWMGEMDNIENFILAAHIWEWALKICCICWEKKLVTKLSM